MPRTQLLIAVLLAATATAHAAKPFLIAPAVEGLLVCDPGSQATYPNSHCTAAGGSTTKALSNLLEALEPGGARGDVQVGYTLTLQLLGLYQRRGSQWVIDEAQVDRALALVKQVDRPAILYLAANHFDSQGAVAKELVADKRNLLQLADGSAPATNYFGYSVAAYTLLTDEAIPVNRLRFAALRHVAARVAALPQAVRNRVVAVTLGGEVHQLFPRFEDGMGNFETPSVTDYSPASQAAFRAWLGKKYGTATAMNTALGGTYRGFDEIKPPAGNALLDPSTGRLNHYDGLAAGVVPVSGWLWDPQGQVQALELVVDGVRVGQIERGFNRLDVYRGVDAVDDPNVGYRHDLDVSQWPQGSYRLQVVARTAQGQREVAVTRLIVGPSRPKGFVAALKRGYQRARFLLERGLRPVPGAKGSLDMPRHDQRVLYNPLARDWDEFRASQVKEFMAQLFAQARAAGLPADLLYSHQIVARVNSSWNAALFATDGSIDAALPWKQGFNTYGGAAGSPWTRRFVQGHGLADYGVPEFHPQQWKRPKAHSEALALHRSLGARFVSPYYFSITSDLKTASAGAIRKLEIRPGNRMEGSDMLYAAIQELATQ